MLRKDSLPNTYRYAWDANGSTSTSSVQRLLNKKKLGVTAATYLYDFENRLVQANPSTSSGQAVNYNYDALGRRIKRTEGSQSTQYIFNGQRVLMEIDGKSKQAVEYVADPAGRLISSLYLSNPSTQASDSRYFQYDGLGSVIGRTNQQGNAVTSYSYEAFGAITSQTGQLGNAYTYMGQAYDSSTGLYYFNARWYDASIGRFISADPLPGNPFQSGSTNRYAYALNNPIAYEDVSGLKSVRAASAQQGSVPEDWLQKDMAALGFFLLGLGIAVVAFGLAVLIAGWGVTAELAAIFIILGALLAILGMIILAFTLPDMTQEEISASLNIAMNALWVITALSALLAGTPGIVAAVFLVLAIFALGYLQAHLPEIMGQTNTQSTSPTLIAA